MPLIIAYGLDALPQDGDLTGLPFVDIRPPMRTLRLNSDALPPGARNQLGLDGTDLFAAVREQAIDRCSPWAAVPRRFLAWYFGEIDARVARHRDELEARLGASEGLYSWLDWRFSAPRPLPRAFLPHPSAHPIRVEIAFWRNGRFLAVESWGGEPTPKARRTKAEALAEAGIDVVDYGPADLTPGNAALLARVLGDEVAFWSAEVLPTGPFAPQILVPA